MPCWREGGCATFLPPPLKTPSPGPLLRRAQRSLARNAVRQKRWGAVAEHWEAALALNPLNPEGWFSLGFAYIKEKDYAKALQASIRRFGGETLKNLKGWFSLGFANIKEKDYAEALQWGSMEMFRGVCCLEVSRISLG